jgi:hypothetical protein
MTRLRISPLPRAWLAATVTTAVLLLLGLVVLSPLALPWIAGARSDWTTPANVGEAYGGVAAILAGLALCGVVVSIAIQRRQLAIQLNLAIRERQFDLTRVLLEYPQATANLLGSSLSTESALLNLHISQYWLVFDTGAHDPATMASELALVFQTEDARRWWADGGGRFWRTFHARRSVAFARVVDEAIDIARSWDVRDDSAERESIAPERRVTSRKGDKRVAHVTVGVGLLVGVGILWWSARNRGPSRAGDGNRFATGMDL